VGIFGGSAQDQVDLAHVNERLDRLESSLASLQGQVAALTTGAVAAGGPPPNPMAGTDPGSVPYGNNVGVGGPWLDEVRRLKAEGKLINAIKLYRENTGVGLKEAKDTVEGMS
jgi:large subunit ribosomal protein L7/L12